MKGMSIQAIARACAGVVYNGSGTVADASKACMMQEVKGVE